MSAGRALALLLAAALLAVGLRALAVWQQLEAERATRRAHLAQFAAEVLADDPRGAWAALATLERASRGNDLLHASLWLLDEKERLLDSVPAGLALPSDFPGARFPQPASGRYVDWADVLPDSGAIAFVAADGPRLLALRTPPQPWLRTAWRLLLQPLLFIVGVAGLVGALVLVYLRGKASEARSVIARLGAGELSARFQIARMDEVGQLMSAFNSMAGEIERLVGAVHHADAARQRLLAELGHDLRTPLTALTNAIDTLDRHPELAAPARQRCARIALREARHVHGLIENLLLLSRTDASDHAPQRQLVLLDSLLREEIESVQELRPELRIDTRIEGDARLAGDADLLRRLLRNLLDNACRHAVSRIDASLARVADRLELVVGDDGTGLPEWLLQGTEPPAQPSRKGLGLLIVRRVLQLHGGDIEFSANPAGGARIRVRLPTLAQAGRPSAPT